MSDERELTKKLIKETIKLLMEGAAYETGLAESYEKEASLLHQMSRAKIDMVNKYRVLLEMLEEATGDSMGIAVFKQ
jgi:hypothetical protein